MRATYQECEPFGGGPGRIRRNGSARTPRRPGQPGRVAIVLTLSRNSEHRFQLVISTIRRSRRAFKWAPSNDTAATIVDEVTNEPSSNVPTVEETTTQREISPFSLYY